MEDPFISLQLSAHHISQRPLITRKQTGGLFKDALFARLFAKMDLVTSRVHIEECIVLLVSLSFRVFLHVCLLDVCTVSVLSLFDLCARRPS